jgi:FkbM family methyltransferase
MRFIINIFYFFEWFFSILQGKGFAGFSCSLKFEVKYISKFFKNNDKLVVIDVGGNKGNFSNIVARSLKNAEIYIIEPSLLNFKFLKKRFINNENIFIKNIAISNKNKNLKLFYDFKGSPLASLSKRLFIGSNRKMIGYEIVKSMTLYKYINENIKKKTIDIIKLDTEGNELNCLLGLFKKIKNVKLIQFEFGGCNIDSRVFFKDFWIFFKKKNFSIYRIGPFGLTKLVNYSESDENFLTTNYIAKNNKFFKLK